VPPIVHEVLRCWGSLLTLRHPLFLETAFWTWLQQDRIGGGYCCCMDAGLSCGIAGSGDLCDSSVVSALMAVVDNE